MKRKAIILISTFALVLTAGVAAAEVSNPSNNAVLAFFGFAGTEPVKDSVEVIAPAEDTKPVNVETDKTDEVETDTKASDESQRDGVADEPQVHDGADDMNDDKTVDGPTDTDVDVVPPPLRITSPEDGAQVDDEFIVFSGVTEPGATVSAGDWVADVRENGEWSIKLRLNPGNNRAAFVATDRAGNTSEAAIRVVYVVTDIVEDRAEDKDERTDHVEFSAHQKYEASDAETPKNTYYGTAAPGTKIWVESKYGAGQTTAVDSGEWSLRVEFPEAPYGVHFDVVVESSDGDRKVFDMVAYGREVDVEFTAKQSLGENDDNWDVFWGTATPGTKVTVSSEYGGGATESNDDGHWEMKVYFDAPAGTTFAVTISDAAGHSKVFEFTNPERTVIEFTANQKYGSCSEDVPYDVFWGTAAPGSTIWVESSFGSGTTTAGDGGDWEIRVEFPEAPAGEKFDVVIESSDGGRKVFGFTNNNE